MSQELFYQWYRLIWSKFPNLKKWQAHGLALISFGIIKTKRSQASLIAEELPGFGKPNTVERRIQRWMANVRIKVEDVFASWISWVMESTQRETIYLLVDETKIGKRVACLMISLAIQKRAIPLVWECYRADSAEDYPEEGQVKMIGEMLRKILVHVPKGKLVILQADRGIGNSSNLMRAVEKCGAKYLFRVKKRSIFTPKDGQPTSIGKLITRGKEWYGSGILFTRKHREVDCHMLLIWDQDQSEPWCLATNLEGLDGREYAMRVWQEESFRDMKSGGWQWQNSLLRNPQITQRMLLPMVIAYAWCVTIGLLFETMAEKIQSEVDCFRKHKKYCVFRMGLRFIKRYLFVNPATIPIQIGPF